MRGDKKGDGKALRAVYNRIVSVGARRGVHKARRTRRVADIVGRERDELQIHVFHDGNVAHNMELRAYRRTNRDTRKEISADTAFAGAAVVPVRMVYRLRAVVRVAYSRRCLRGKTRHGNNRRCDTGLGYRARGNRERDNELGRGVCKGGRRHGA